MAAAVTENEQKQSTQRINKRKQYGSLLSVKTSAPVDSHHQYYLVCVAIFLEMARLGNDEQALGEDNAAHK
jgi:hypothetical protein